MDHKPGHDHVNPYANVTKEHLLQSHHLDEKNMPVDYSGAVALHGTMHGAKLTTYVGTERTEYVDDQGIFDMGETHMFQLPCKHMVKVNRLLHGDSDEVIRAAILEHMNSHVTILVRLGPGNPISRTLAP